MVKKSEVEAADKMKAVYSRMGEVLDGLTVPEALTVLYNTLEGISAQTGLPVSVMIDGFKDVNARFHCQAGNPEAGIA